MLWDEKFVKFLSCLSSELNDQEKVSISQFCDWL